MKKENSSPKIEENENSMSKADINKTLESTKKHKLKWGWPLKILFITLGLSFSFGLMSEFLIKNNKSITGLIVSLVLLFVFIIISVVFDMIGVAATSAQVEPFMAMASKKVRGAKESIKLIKNAEKISSFCCDIVGDACGIMCGSIGASIAVMIMSSGNIWKIIIASVVSAVIAAITVFGKALGKTIAVNDSNKIVFRVGKLVSKLKLKKKNK